MLVNPCTHWHAFFFFFDALVVVPKLGVCVAHVEILVHWNQMYDLLSMHVV